MSQLFTQDKLPGEPAVKEVHPTSIKKNIKIRILNSYPQAVNILTLLKLQHV